MAVPSFLARERIVARPGFNRWLIPPAALAVHLCIGQAYATSVYKTALVEHFDASLTAIGIIFSIAIVMLGLSAAVVRHLGGPQRSRARPCSPPPCFWSTGFLVGSLGIATEQLWLVYFGYGVLGGIGLGIGYISPVSTLIKWFPDRPGPGHRHGDHGLRRRRADRLAAVAPADELLRPRVRRAPTGTVPSRQRRRPAVPDPRAWSTWSSCSSARSSCACRPTTGSPTGFDPSTVKQKSLVTTDNVSAGNAIKTPQFWLLWTVLFCNVTAGHRHPRAGRADDPGLLPRPATASARRGDGGRRVRRRCCRCSTWAAGSCGRRRRTTSAASRCT